MPPPPLLLGPDQVVLGVGRRGPDSGPAPPPARPSSQCARSAAARAWACMRRLRVSSPLRKTQALKGLMVGPAVRRTPKTSSPTRLRSPTTAPPTQRPCPSRYLVAEWMTRSAPSSSGRCRAGVQKQLSTASRQPWRVGEVRQGADVAHLGQGVGRGLAEQQPGVRAGSPRPRRRGRLSADIARGDAEAAQVLVEQDRGAAEDAARGDHVVPGLEQAHADGEDGRHARGGGDAATRPPPGRPGAPRRRAPWGW